MSVYPKFQFFVIILNSKNFYSQRSYQELYYITYEFLKCRKIGAILEHQSPRIVTYIKNPASCSARKNALRSVATICNNIGDINKYW